ncbi:MAG: glycosyltransferase family 4 protein [Candidatus Schekmanbacteria bacterium]|nr:glycosyltransferase family 4 protein [Candidatus Schekmanbacteria bacterium]
MRLPRIGIDARKLDDYGIGTYIRHLLSGLQAAATRFDFRIAARHPADPALQSQALRTVVMSATNYSLGELLALSRFVRREGLDLFHAPHYVLPPLRKCRKIVTIHDIIHLLFPEFLSPAGRLYARLMLRFASREADLVLTVSEASKADLVAHLDVPPERVRVVYNGVSERFRPQAEQSLAETLRALGLTPGYVLFAGNLMPHKNVGRALEALAALRGTLKEELPALVIAGHGRPDRVTALRAQAERLRIVTKVVFLGHVDHAVLPALYGAARAFIFPSLYEGFGLPPLEAMACGVPVVYGRNPALIEIVGAAGLAFDPRSTDDAAQALARALTDEELRQNLITAGIRRAREFRWSDAVSQTLAAYEELLDGSARGHA